MLSNAEADVLAAAFNGVSMAGTEADALASQRIEKRAAQLALPAAQRRLERRASASLIRNGWGGTSLDDASMAPSSLQASSMAPSSPQASEIDLEQPESPDRATRLDDADTVFDEPIADWDPSRKISGGVSITPANLSKTTLPKGYVKLGKQFFNETKYSFSRRDSNIRV